MSNTSPNNTGTVVPTELSNVVKLKDEYYEKHTKNVFMKSSQKFDCAREICSKVDIVGLFDQTFWVIPNKNRFYFDYRVYKLYGNPDNFRLMIDNILHMTKWCIQEYGSFEIHLNLSSFTISAAERYKSMIQMFCDVCMSQTDCAYLPNLVTMNIYNIPTVFDHISKLLMPILPPEIVPKIKLIHKNDSLSLMKQLYEDSGKIYTA
jgi:hypothetical protein